MMRRVVITGIGMITPVGTGMDKSWSSLLSGQSGVQEVQSFDPSKFRVKIAGEVKDFDPRTFMSLTQQDRMGRGAQYTYAVTQMAIEDAGLSIGELTSSMVGFYLGSTMGEAQVLENIVKNQVLGRPVPRQEYMHFPSHQMISTVMDEFKLNGPSNFSIMLVRPAIMRSGWRPILSAEAKWTSRYQAEWMLYPKWLLRDLTVCSLLIRNAADPSTRTEKGW